ncbi:uncharacterized protein BDW43DRAFT_309304 [Aspergillus alliaceus]|uniref:uncharacterized protein n=1 Tax=Petromyces alliaceus TaxID=209559 RepID=UPI0012A4B8F9|nr:uncharacterized protein BDW43DRAFT_309304 [Aspergillus alliaceus]KAB8235438.1 hypothetical protein BDW43DRAFT_309304 [Aspergillus alliaceus]
MAATKDSDLLNSTPIRTKEYDSYPWELLKDHQLRSHPTECIPVLSSAVAGCLAVMRRRWTERVFPLVCLFLMFLMVVQFLAALPYGLSYIFLRNGNEGKKGFAQWPAEFSKEPGTCILHNPQTHDPVQDAIDAGCSGVRVDIRVHEDELMSSPMSGQGASDTLHSLYLDRLLTRLDARNSAEISPASSDGPGLMGLLDDDPALPLTILLQFHTLVQTVWPRLVSQLMPLKEKGYLSHRTGTQVVPRPVTIVLTGLDASDFVDIIGSGPDDILDSIMLDIPLERLEKEGYDSMSNLSGPFHGSRSHASAQSDLDPENRLTPPHELYQLLTATVNFTRSIGLPHRGGRFSAQQIERVRAQVQAAHRRGLRIRYEGITCYPLPLRRMIWRILVHEGADLIEMEGMGDEIPWWRRFLLAREMECHGRREGTRSRTDKFV